jgi:hypothetical protein
MRRISAGAKSLILKMLNKNQQTHLSTQEILEDVWVCRHTQREEVIKLVDLLSNLILVHFQCIHDMILNLSTVKIDYSIKTSAPENTNAFLKNNRHKALAF